MTVILVPASGEDIGVRSVDGTNGPLTPFAIVEAANGDCEVLRFMTAQTPDESRQHARAHVAKTSDCVKYAVVADGTATENGTRIPVIMAEVGQRGEPHGYSFIQRFTSTRETRYAEAIRNPSIIDEPAILEPSIQP